MSIFNDPTRPRAPKRNDNKGQYVVIGIIVAVAIALAFLFVSGAFGQDAVVVRDTRVDLNPLIDEILPYFLMVLGTIVTAALTWVAKKFNDSTGMNIEAKHREALQSALLNGARAAIDRYRPEELSIDVRNAALKEGVEFVIRSVPDAVDYFDLSPDDIQRHLQPKMNVAKTENKIANIPIAPVG